MSARIAVEAEMAACVRGMDGVVLDDVLVQPDFQNADYWFPKSNVVAKLKCLTEDLASNAVFTKKISDLYAKWEKAGRVPRLTAARTKVNLRDLPLKCACEFLDPIMRKLETSTIRKAGRQIRETKAYLNAPDAKGLLLLANDGKFMFPPTMMIELLGRILKARAQASTGLPTSPSTTWPPSLELPCPVPLD